jgi:hypothetical protein
MMIYDDQWRQHCVLCVNARPLPPPGIERLQFTLAYIQAHYASPEIRAKAIRWLCPDGLVRPGPRIDK